MTARDVILASGSSSRRIMLKAAGVAFTAISPSIDEEAMKNAFLERNMATVDLSNALAEAKARSVSAQYPSALVIGGDQVLVCGGVLFSKAANREEARKTLLALRGTEHMLISAAVLAEAGKVIWRKQETATLRMREFSEAFLETYLDQELPDILGSVGCYRVEGRGAQLFEKIEGDAFCIRGLPLVFVLEALREHGGLQR